MCLAIPGKIKEIKGERILVAYPEEMRLALAGGESVKVGDFVMVQMGIVIKILTPAEIRQLKL
jgi:hydrogenase maturation factor